MSYCRFSNADIYLFYHVDNYISCCSCSLAPKVKTIFTTGCEKGEHFLYPDGKERCDKCNGEGCDSCMMFGEAAIKTYKEAIQHVRDHIANGDHVPDSVIPRLEREARIEKYSNGRTRKGKAIRRHLKKLAGRKKYRRFRNGKKHRLRMFPLPMMVNAKKKPIHT